MADNAIGELPAVAIGDLPLAPDIYDDTLIPVEIQGNAMHITGAQWTNYAKSASKAYVQTAVDSADNAEKSAEGAKSDADRAEAARESIVVDEEKLAQAVENAENSAAAAAESETSAIEAMNKAQGYAEQASVPAVEGVYNVILTDRTTAERYALIVDNGSLVLLGVSDALNAVDVNLIDNTSGTAYALVVEDGKIILEEV